MCSCSECTSARLGGASSVVPQAERDVARYVAPPPDDDDDEGVDGDGDDATQRLEAAAAVLAPAMGWEAAPPERDELAVRVAALELAAKRRETELRSAHVRLDAQERRIDELESSMRAMQRAFSPPAAG